MKFILAFSALVSVACAAVIPATTLASNSIASSDHVSKQQRTPSSKSCRSTGRLTKTPSTKKANSRLDVKAFAGEKGRFLNNAVPTSFSARVPDESKIIIPGIDYLSNADGLHWHENQLYKLQRYASKCSEIAWRRTRDEHLRFHRLAMSFEMEHPFNRSPTIGVVNVYNYTDAVLIFVDLSRGRNFTDSYIHQGRPREWGAPVTTNVYNFMGYPPASRTLESYLANAENPMVKEKLRSKVKTILDVATDTQKPLVIMAVADDDTVRVLTTLLAIELATEDYRRGTTTPRTLPYILRNKSPVDTTSHQKGSTNKYIDFRGVPHNTKPSFILPVKPGLLRFEAKYEADFLLVEPQYWDRALKAYGTEEDKLEAEYGDKIRAWSLKTGKPIEQIPKNLRKYLKPVEKEKESDLDLLDINFASQES